jgi:long-chain fatty acid transport protein
MTRIAALTVLLTLVAAPARASLPDLIGLGTRSPALAGLGAADSDDWEATWLNPAGLAHAPRRRLTIGYVAVRQRLRLDGAPRPIEPTDGILIGATLPLPFGGLLRDRLAIGLGFYYPFGVVNRARDAFPGEPRLALLDDRTQVVSILVSLGVRLHRRVSLGIGVLALAALTGEIRIAQDATGATTTISEQQLVTSFAPVAGLRIEAAPWLTVGVALRGESRSSYDIRIKADLGDLLPFTLPVLRIAGVAQYDPLQMAFEGSLRPTRWLRALVGLTWKHWSAYPNPIENATEGAAPLPPPEFHDTVVPRAGLEARLPLDRRHGGRLLALTLRGGYAFEWSPAPTGPTRSLLDASRHVVAGGLGLGWSTRRGGFSGSFDIFGQAHFLDGDGAPRATGRMNAFGAALGLDL